LASVDLDDPYVYNYDVSSVSNDFATCAHMHAMPKGDFVALVIRISAVEVRTTTEGDEYLQVHGLDMDGCTVGPLRLWRFNDGDLIHGQIVVLRGMKVVQATTWDHNEWKYVVDWSSANTVECSFRTAAEDVSHVPAVVAFFQG
jgi:hypothetical protein